MIIAPNHFSFLDHFFVAVYLRRKVGSWPSRSSSSLRCSSSTGTAASSRSATGHRDESLQDRAHRSSSAATDRDVRRGRPLPLEEARQAAPRLRRLALETGVPVVPTAIAGSEHARNWKRLQFPKVTLQYGKPVRFEKVENPARAGPAGLRDRFPGGQADARAAPARRPPQGDQGRPRRCRAAEAAGRRPPFASAGRGHSQLGLLVA